MEAIPIPELMADLPTYRGLPIPVTTLIGPDGTPDFKASDERKRLGCLQHRLCGLCGKMLGKTIIFVGGDSSVLNRLFFDPPNHEECALYAAKACPFLANADWDYSRQAPRHAKVMDISYVEVMSNIRPWRMALYYCSDYDAVKMTGHWIFKANKPIKINWDAMPKRAQGTKPQRYAEKP